jgi:hypothetical protein
MQRNRCAEVFFSLSIAFKQLARIFVIAKALIENQSKVQTRKSEEKVQTVPPGQ